MNIKPNETKMIDGTDYCHDENYLLLKFTESALAGSAAQLAMRHDFTPERFAKLAVQIARAAIAELKNE